MPQNFIFLALHFCITKRKSSFSVRLSDIDHQAVYANSFLAT